MFAGEVAMEKVSIVVVLAVADVGMLVVMCRAKDTSWLQRKTLGCGQLFKIIHANVYNCKTQQKE